jgi:hypothetical protein
MRFKNFLAELEQTSGRIIDGNDVEADTTFTNLTKRFDTHLDRGHHDDPIDGDEPLGKIIHLIASKRHLKMNDPELVEVIKGLDGKERQSVAARLKQTHSYIDSELRRLEKFLDTAKKPDGTPLFPSQRAGTKPSVWLRNTGNDVFIQEIYDSWATFSGAQLTAKIKDLEAHYTDKVAQLIEDSEKASAKGKPSRKHMIAAGSLHYLTELRETTNKVLQELMKTSATA